MTGVLGAGAPLFTIKNLNTQICIHMIVCYGKSSTHDQQVYC